MKKIFFLGAMVWGLIACTSTSEKAQGQWIKGSEQAQLDAIEKQFRGFDMAMVETGYRYQELYWAGQDENWEYASYQLEKIKKAINNGLMRRPARAKSAQTFLHIALPNMQKAIDSKDTLTFNQEFNTLTAQCLACHSMEKVPYFTVKTPTRRVSPISK